MWWLIVEQATDFPSPSSTDIMQQQLNIGARSSHDAVMPQLQSIDEARRATRRWLRDTRPHSIKKWSTSDTQMSSSSGGCLFGAWAWIAVLGTPEDSVLGTPEDWLLKLESFSLWLDPPKLEGCKSSKQANAEPTELTCIALPIWHVSALWVVSMACSRVNTQVVPANSA